jgi:hypothetical protein
MAGLVWPVPKKKKGFLGPRSAQHNPTQLGPAQLTRPDQAPTIYILKQNKKQKKIQKIPKILSKNL